MVLLWMILMAALCRTSQGDDALASPASVQTDHTDNSNITTISTLMVTKLKPTRDKRGVGQISAELSQDNDNNIGNEDEQNNIDTKIIKRSRGSYAENPRRFSSWAGKRAKFSSWGGKRFDENFENTLPRTRNLIENNFETPEEKRAKFSSWAGKRAEEEEDNSLNGNSLYDLENFDQTEEKRARFSSWAGKRDEAKRRFSSWAGKRFDDNLQDLNRINEEKRAKFNSWGGKRAKFNSWGGKRFNDEDNHIFFDENIAEEKRKMIFPWKNNINELYDNGKRAKFSSWGGKRDDNELWDNEKRARFNSWGGKRNNANTSEILVDHEDGLFKRSAAAYTPLSWKRKPIFSSWGGKRTARSAQPQRRLIFPNNLFRERTSWGALLRPIRRGPDFYAWGGKRST